jgi:hypothetical protein
VRYLKHARNIIQPQYKEQPKDQQLKGEYLHTPQQDPLQPENTHTYIRSAPTDKNNKDHSHFRTGDGAKTAHRAPVTALEGEADYPQISSAPDSAHHNEKSIEKITQPNTQPIYCCSRSPYNIISGRRVAVDNNATCHPVEMNMTHAKHKWQRGT